MGEWFVILFFGIVAVSGTVFIQTGGWPPQAFLLGVQVGLLSAVLISINNLRDGAEDATTGKRTLAVRLGARGGKTVIAAELALALLAAAGWWAIGLPRAAWAVTPLLPTAFLILKEALGKEPGAHLNRCLALGGVQLLLFAAAFHMALGG
jgi:1,4-dihydroxy-2-naphthoate octaprenyltransferase